MDDYQDLDALAFGDLFDESATVAFGAYADDVPYESYEEPDVDIAESYDDTGHGEEYHNPDADGFPPEYPETYD